ncbi:hypothetical protein ACLOJK_007002 [Asimina triloba]
MSPKMRGERNSEEFVVDDLRDRIQSSRGSRFNLITNEFGLEQSQKLLTRDSFLDGIKGCSGAFVILPDNRPVPLSLSLSLSLSPEYGSLFPPKSQALDASAVSALLWPVLMIICCIAVDGLMRGACLYTRLNPRKTRVVNLQTLADAEMVRAYEAWTNFTVMRYLLFCLHPSGICWYEVWTNFILLWAIYSSFFTPLEFGFFRGLPKNLFFLDNAAQVFFLIDMVTTFFVAYRDSQTYRMVHNRNRIALRLLALSIHGSCLWQTLCLAKHLKQVAIFQ